MKFKQRTQLAGSLRASNVGERVILNGWVDGNRDLGGWLFFDLRDRAGKVQCVVDPTATQEVYAKAKTLRSEYVVSVEGVVRNREKVNPKMETGEIEILLDSLLILNEADVPPFEIKEEVTANEDLRLKYRYLDLRRAPLQQNLITRHKVCQSTRNYFSERGFIEVETPILMKATPEGARDFLVPSRLHHGEFYALPQSPQLYKQILMISGMDRYFQIAKCFRDEDLRADRQPEFTQLDMEMSFPDEETIYEVMENFLIRVWSDLGMTLPSPFPRLTYHEAMARYGSDKPDLRYGLELTTLTELLRGKTEFKPFNEVHEKRQGTIAAIVAPGAASWSRKQLDSLTDLAKIYGASGLIWVKVTEQGIDSSAKKFLNEDLLKDIVQECKAGKDDLILIGLHAKREKAYTIMGALRIELAKRLGLLEGKTFTYAPAWITDFPVFEIDEESGALTFKHHPFTSPNVEDWARRHEDPEGVRARSYDLVMNGYELGSGSIRIHDRKLQEEVFDILGHTKEQQEDKFGFILQAFQYGAPPHGGMALGIDRITMLCCGTENIRDVIAFPKTTSMQSLMDDAPSAVEERQLRELRISVTQKKNTESEIA